MSEQKGTFVNQHRRERIEDLLRTRAQGPNESVTGFVDDVLHLSTSADTQAAEEKELRILMRRALHTRGYPRIIHGYPQSTGGCW